MALRRAEIQTHRARDGQFYNVLVGRNGEPMMMSETFPIYANAKRSAKAVKRAAPLAKLVDRTD